MATTSKQANANQEEDDDDDHEEETAAYIWIVSMVVAGIAMALAGKVRWAAMILILAVLFWGVGSSLTPLSEAEKKAIEYNIWSPEDCWEEVRTKSKTLNVPSRLAVLAALSKKYSATLMASKVSDKIQSSSSVSTLSRREEVALMCHNAAYELILVNEDTVVPSFAAKDQVLDAALALLALVAGDSMVRRSYLDTDRIESVVKALRTALERAKTYRDGEAEQRGAELQRKGCLLLGALANTANNDANGNSTSANLNLGKMVLGSGGMKSILDALSWYRFHEHIANWALWAIFTLLYDEQDGSQAIQELLNANGGPILLAAMENCGQDLDVARHGIAIVFHMVVAKNIPLPPIPVTNLVEQILSVHSAGASKELPTDASVVSTSAQNQINLMGRDILVKIKRQASFQRPRGVNSSLTPVSKAEKEVI